MPTTLGTVRSAALATVVVVVGAPEEAPVLRARTTVESTGTESGFFVFP